jgi:hypothetical protein
VARVLLFHWKESEAAERAARVAALGHAVETVTAGGHILRRMNEFAPEALVISLERLPAHGLAVGALTRSRQRSRGLPLVFVEGEPEKVERVRAALPDATFTTWGRLKQALAGALRRVIADPARPSIGIANPGRPLATRLGITPGARVVTFNAPESFERTLGALPEGAEMEENGRGPATVAILFCDAAAILARDFARAEVRLGGRGKLWIAWPKKAARARTDVDMLFVRAFALERGWVDYKVCSIDATWSGSLFGRRRAAAKR